jgi:hypothetical protein
MHSLLVLVFKKSRTCICVGWNQGLCDSSLPLRGLPEPPVPSQHPSKTFGVGGEMRQPSASVLLVSGEVKSKIHDLSVQDGDN